MKIICIGRNYVEHAKELNNEIPDEPVVFIKPSTSLLVNNKHFYHPEFSKDIHYEAEVVLKICKNGRHVHPDFARSYFKEITIGIDLTARDLQQKLKAKGLPWEKAKAFDHAAVIGKFIKANALQDDNITFQLKKNGKLVQDGNTGNMMFSFVDIICHVSKYFKLQVGDFIFTGTPAGVGRIEIGDLLTGSVEGKDLLRCEIR
ncbi:MAG: fumarylacetoacetate hydrolase family protein [Chitinophagales bacterium]|nr:fumarylacetoacetate hydrolase family protein [Chitinophagales bacterium]